MQRRQRLLCPRASFSEDLGEVGVALGVEGDADADFGPGGGEDVLAVAGGGHESGLGFGDAGVVGDVFTGGGEGIAEGAEHNADVAVGGGFVGEIVVVAHVLGLDAGDAGKLGIQGQGGQAVGGSVGIEQIPCSLLLRRYGISSIIIIR